MKTETLTISFDNRMKLVKFLGYDFASVLLLDKFTHFDPDYVAAIPQMMADVKQIVKALSSKETNNIRIEDVVTTYSQCKPFTELLEKSIRYLVSERWKPKEDWLQIEHRKEQILPGYPDLKYLPRDKDIDVMHGNLIEIINLLK